jgi:DNA topoisomerase IB
VPSRREVAINPKRTLAAALTERVAQQLGNTASICREYYIHPDVFEACLGDGFDPKPEGRTLPGQKFYRVHERRTMEIL